MDLDHSGSIATGPVDNDTLMQEILELLATGRVKLPHGIDIIEVNDDYQILALPAPVPPDDDPDGVG